MARERAFWICFICFFALLACLAWGWLLSINHGPRWWLVAALALCLTAVPVIAGLFLAADVEAAQGMAAHEWSRAGYVRAEKKLAPRITRFLFWEWETPRSRRVWVAKDMNGDGVIEEGEGEWEEREPRISVMGQGPEPNDPAAAEAYHNRLRSLLTWCYRRQATANKHMRPGEIYGQVPGRVAFPGTYDDDMHALQRLGLIRGRATGHVGKLVLDSLQEALQRFDGA